MNREQQLEKLRKKTDKDIDFSDIPDITGNEDWQPNSFFRPVKEQISAKVDKDVIAWIKRHGEVSGFVNKILRQKMIEERKTKITA